MGSSDRPVRDSVRFFGSFVRKPGSVGAVTPSSRWLASALVGELPLGDGDVLVEYGPGTGPMTRVIDARLRSGAQYLGIELDPGFHDLLVQRFPSRRFVRASAADVVALLAEYGLGKPKRIISGIPFASLPEPVQQGIVVATKEALHAEGEFRTFQYVHAYRLKAAKRFRGQMGEVFGGFERLGPIVRNVPPAYVLVYRH